MKKFNTGNNENLMTISYYYLQLTFASSLGEGSSVSCTATGALLLSPPPS
jgi:hypothetical protein